MLNYSIFFEHEDYYTPVNELISRENGGISVLCGRQVVKLDPHKKRVYLDDGSEISYEKCLLATGMHHDVYIFLTYYKISRTQWKDNTVTGIKYIQNDQFNGTHLPPKTRVHLISCKI